MLPRMLIIIRKTLKLFDRQILICRQGRQL